MKITNFLCWMLSSAAFVSTGTASAQTVGSSSQSAAPDRRVDDIIVTAQKRSERLNDVPLSITAATGDQLAKQGITNPADLEKIVTGFTYQRSSYGVPVFSIRGIGFLDTALFVSPAVTVYVDQVPFAFPPMTAGVTLDVERVEALKGPQGTLFGQNSTGGAINYIAAKPTETLKAGADVSYGRFSSVEAQGYISGPLTDTLSARVAIRTEQSGDWQENYTRDDSHGERHFTTGRLMLDWKPNDTVRFGLNLNGWKDTSDTQVAQFLRYAPAIPNGTPEQAAALPKQRIAPNNARAADWDDGYALKRDDRFYQLALHSDIDLSDAVTLNAITAYSDYKQNALTDPDGSGFHNLMFNKSGTATSFSQELRASGQFGGDTVRWMVGGNYQRDKTSDTETLVPPNFGSIGALGPFRINTFANLHDEKIETKAVFGSLDFKVTDQFNAHGSVRYSDQTRHFQGCFSDIDGSLAAGTGFLFPLIGVTGATARGRCVTFNSNTHIVQLDPQKRTLKEDNLSWRVGLDYKPNRDFMLYANVTKGYKAGSFPTLAGLDSSEYDPVVQESVLAYEAGVKLSAGSVLQLSGAVFHYDYRDKQILGFYDSLLFGSLPALVNVPKSKVDGIELEWTLRPISGLRISGGATYVSSKVTGNFITSDPFGVKTDIKGERFPNSPKWMLNGDVEYDFPVTEKLNAFVGGSARYRTASYAAFGRTPLFLIKDYATVDLRAGIAETDGAWRAEIWGRNITNTYYWNNVSHLADTVARNAGMPVTYGVKLSYRY